MWRWPALAAAMLLGCNVLTDLDDLVFRAEGGAGSVGGAGSGAVGASGGIGGETGNGGNEAGAGGSGGSGGNLIGSGGSGGNSGGSGGSGGGTAPCADPTRRIAFVTLAPVNPGAGTAALDALCQSEAFAAGCGAKSFVAWLSSNEAVAFNAADRIASGTWGLPNGPNIADDNVDLLDGTIDHPLDIHADGTTQANVYVWTGTYDTGLASGEDCDGWTQSVIGFDARNGTTMAQNLGWTNESVLDCELTILHLYCFEAP